MPALERCAKIMKPSIIAILASFAILYQVKAADPLRVFTPDTHGVVAMDGAPDHVVDLIEQIKGTDMKRWILSEVEGPKWLVSKMTIIEPDLILVRLSDGHGAEDVLFDQDYEKHWTIIRRAPVGDWKPKEQRHGDRLSALRFPEQKAQQDGGGQPATRPESK